MKASTRLQGKGFCFKSIGRGDRTFLCFQLKKSWLYAVRIPLQGVMCDMGPRLLCPINYSEMAISPPQAVH